MAKFNSKSFNGQAFAKYVAHVPNTKKAEIQKSAAITSDANVHDALSNQTGSLYARVPYFANIDADSVQNNDGATDIVATTTTTYEAGYITASRMKAFTEKSFSKNITAGVDFLGAVAAQISMLQEDIKEDIVLSMLDGAFSMTSGTMTKAFLDNHVYDITSTGTGMVEVSTLNKAMTKACGANKDVFKMVFMHSVVAMGLENENLLSYLKYTDKDGVQRDLGLATWSGRLVVVTDEVPVEEVAESVPGKGDGYTKYTTYVLGEGSVIVDEVFESNPYEMVRDALKNGGMDTLVMRVRYALGISGLSFEKPASITASASNTDLATGANWTVINDGTAPIDHKAIALCKIVSRG